MTNSNRKIHHKNKTQSYGLTRQRGGQATVLDFSPGMGDGSGSDEHGDVVQPTTRRGHDQRPGWRTHVPANERSADQRDPARSATSADTIPPDGHTSAPRLTNDRNPTASAVSHYLVDHVDQRTISSLN